jgi:trk system potassium uptake protein TrkA
MVASAYAPTTCRKIARIRHPDYMNDPSLFRKDLGIDFHINPEYAACQKFLKLLEVPQAQDIVPFDEGRVLLLELKLPEFSTLYGKTLSEIGTLYPDRRLLAVAIERKGDLIIPRGEHCLQKDDLLFLAVKPDKLGPILARIGSVQRELQYVMIAGASRIGMFIAQYLEKEGISVRIIERSRERCKMLAENLHRSLILHGDAKDRSLLINENVHLMDAFIAVSEDEEFNILSSLVAKRIGVPQILALANKTSYAPLASHLGINAIISPRRIAANLILQFVRRGHVLQVDAFADEQGEAIEFIAQNNAPIVGLPLKSISFPKDAIIGAIINDHSATIPNGDSIIASNDRVIVFTLRRNIQKVENFFMSVNK